MSRATLSQSVFLALLAGLAPISANGQTLVGVVLDAGTGDPVAGTTVSLVDEGGTPVSQVVSDALGKFTLRPPAEGEYIVETQRIGYSTTRSPLLALSAEGSASFEVMITRQPIGLAGFEVSVESQAEEYLGLFGLDPGLTRGPLDRPRGDR